MTESIIHVAGLGKKYRLGQAQSYGSLRDSLSGVFQKQEKVEKKSTDFWALRNLTFDIQSGERLGVIGRNGAGKSTLLKILSQITTPTEGRAILRGRVSSLLEVGTGFHPELTGRENIFLNGAILGMAKSEIRRKFDEIVEFSGIGQFIDTPVKRYSSGMYVRLAFAVAAHLEPDILVVDEVLAVGDAQFQKKCLGKMQEVGQAGRTIIFVSHNMAAIKTLCTSGVYLKKGVALGKLPITEAISSYVSDSSSNDNAYLPITRDYLTIEAFSITQFGVQTAECNGDEPIVIHINFSLAKQIDKFRIGFYIKSMFGDIVTRSLLADWDSTRERLDPGHYQTTATVPANTLTGGSYIIELHASRYGIIDYGIGDVLQQPLSINMPRAFNPAYPGEQSFGYLLLKPDWDIQRA